MLFSKPKPTMKLTAFVRTLPIAIALAIAATGCHKNPENMTNLPGYRKGMVGEVPEDANANTTGIASSGISTNESISGIPMSDPSTRADWPRDRQVFKSDTVHFDFDSSIVKISDRPKIGRVAEYLKANPAPGLEIEGHCDERGTEEYNRALGDRRAMALREELARLGVDPKRIDTVSYGKDKPVANGRDNASWAKNRRGEFVLEVPLK
jgi:peptidoglycan-associated lipoprotein